MGNRKQKWTQEEEDALRQGVEKHGTGKWKDIQRDPEFNKFLFSRSNIDLKDKWRNLIGGGSGQGQRDKSRGKTKAVADATPSLPNQPAIPNTSVADEATGEAMVDGSGKIVDETKSVARYDGMISEALSNLNEPNGSEVGAIFSYIEKSHEVSHNFRRQLRARLKRLVVGGKLEELPNLVNDIHQGVKIQFFCKTKIAISKKRMLLWLLKLPLRFLQLENKIPDLICRRALGVQYSGRRWMRPPSLARTGLRKRRTSPLSRRKQSRKQREWRR